MELNKYILLQKQVKDNSEDLQIERLDMKNWEEKMKREEQKLLNESNEPQNLPPIRSKKQSLKYQKNKTIDKSKRIKSCDYAAWDNFANQVSKEIDEESHESSEESSEESCEELETREIAIKHKERGNLFVQLQKWDEAITSYTQAIETFSYDAVFFANRALCYLKQDKLRLAETDCTTAIQLDNTYLKAYHRRATARIGLKQYKEAKEDIEKVLSLDSSNKETKVLLTQVEKFLKNSKPLHSHMNRKDRTKDTSVEKKLTKKILDNIESTKLDTKEEKNRKLSYINTPTAVTTVINKTESKRDPRIPDWLPEKDNVEIVEPVEKPPHLRFQETLKRIRVQETDLSKHFKEEIKASCNISPQIKSSTLPDNIIKCNKNIKTSKLEQNDNITCAQIPPVPKTAVQFLTTWRNKSSDFRYKYLKQLPVGSLPKIIQDSMESNIFSDILAVLKIEFMKRQEPISSYLKDLSNVKRFRAFTLFLSNSEKEDLKLVLLYCKTSEKISEEEYMDLQTKYEI